MNIELTTDNLQKSCRLCLNKGDINLWEHKITIPNPDNVPNDENKEADNEIEVHKLFQIYNRFEDVFFGLNEELKLICHVCLEELIRNYKFYGNAERSNKQIQRLYKEACKIEAEQLIEVVVEVMDQEDDESIYSLDEQAENLLTVDEVESDEATEIDEVEEYVDEAETVSDCAIEETLNIATDDTKDDCVMLLETSMTSDVQHITEDSDININSDEFIAVIANEEIDTQITEKEDCEASLRPVRTPSDATLPPQDTASLVITQFLPPAVVENFLENSNSQGMLLVPPDDTGGGVNEHTKQIKQPTDLRTMDYAAIEVNTANFEQIVVDDLQFSTSTISPPPRADHRKSPVEQTAEAAVYVCKYCPQAFSAPHYLMAHSRKSHVCKYCTQAFVKSMDLFVHIRQAHHHKHKCAICNKELSSHSNLRGHIKRVHGIRLPAQVALLDYKPTGGASTDYKDCSSSITVENNMDMYF